MKTPPAIANIDKDSPRMTHPKIVASNGGKKAI